MSNRCGKHDHKILKNGSDCCLHCDILKQSWPPGGERDTILTRLRDRCGADGRRLGWNFSFSHCSGCQKQQSEKDARDLREGNSAENRSTTTCHEITSFVPQLHRDHKVAKLAQVLRTCFLSLLQWNCFFFYK